MSDFPPPPPAGGPPPPPPPPPPPGGYGQAPMGQMTGVPRPGELLDRFLARLIDGVLYGVVSVILGLVFAAILVSNRTFDLSTGEYDGGSRVLYNIVSSVISTAIVLGYYAFLESTRGQTVGKMVMKLKVIAPGGGNPTLVQAAKRNIYLAFGLLGILGGIGTALNFLLSLGALVLLIVGIQALPNRQTKFDEFAGGTQVLKIG